MTILSCFSCIFIDQLFSNPCLFAGLFFLNRLFAGCQGEALTLFTEGIIAILFLILCFLSVSFFFLHFPHAGTYPSILQKEGIHSCPCSKEQSLLQNQRPYQVDPTRSLVQFFLNFKFFSLCPSFRNFLSNLAQIQFISSCYYCQSLCKANPSQFVHSTCQCWAIGQTWVLCL